MEAEIVYEDGELLVCRKPAGVPVQSARVGVKDLVSILKNDRNEREGVSYLGIVHRIDQPVEGLLVFAKTQGAAADLSRQLANGEMKKEYLAVVSGQPAQKEGHLVDYLYKDGRTNTSSIVPKSRAQAKRAELYYRVRARIPGYALVEIRLLTGRHHQIRVQMAGAGMPLAGDRKYHAKAGQEEGRYVALASYRLAFSHPVTKERLEFTACPKGEMFGRFQETMQPAAGRLADG